MNDPCSAHHGIDGRVVEPSWQVRDVGRIEELRDAVLGSGLEAVQMTSRPVKASLAFAERRGITITCGHIGGNVAFRGPLSERGVSLGLGLRIPPGSMQWQQPVETGSVGIYRAGHEHDSLHRAGSLYVVVTTSVEQLEQEAASYELVLDESALGTSRILEQPVDPGLLAGMSGALLRIHAGQGVESADPFDALLRLITTHCARQPRWQGRRAVPPRRARVVRLDREYITAHLHEPICIDDIAGAALTSRRTLHRAFMELVGEAPQSFVRRLRLHRIRYELSSENEAACSIALVANRWGIGEPGRMAGWYRELFGEFPSETVAGRRCFAARGAPASRGLAQSA